MTDHPFGSLSDRGKEPTVARHLDSWIEQAVDKTGVTASRIGWMVASSVAIGALQRAVDPTGGPLLLLKGGAYLELVLGLRARSTSDVDTVFRGEIENLVEALDVCLAQPWGPLQLARTEVEIMEGVRRVAKPRRFKMKISINGRVWRSIAVEVAADEAGIGERTQTLGAVPLGHFGLPTAESLAGIALDFQVAQKLHACTDPHDPPSAVNTRARDLVDLMLLRDAFYTDPETSVDLRSACVALFESRAAEADALGHPGRAWPPVVVTHPGWPNDFSRACMDAGVKHDLDRTVAHINDWVHAIART